LEAGCLELTRAMYKTAQGIRSVRVAHAARKTREERRASSARLE
jgi:hypothetical protein